MRRQLSRWGIDLWRDGGRNGLVPVWFGIGALEWVTATVP